MPIAVNDDMLIEIWNRLNLSSSKFVRRSEDEESPSQQEQANSADLPSTTMARIVMALVFFRYTSPSPDNKDFNSLVTALDQAKRDSSASNSSSSVALREKVQVAQSALDRKLQLLFRDILLGSEEKMALSETKSDSPLPLQRPLCASWLQKHGFLMEWDATTSTNTNNGSKDHEDCKQSLLCPDLPSQTERHPDSPWTFDGLLHFAAGLVDYFTMSDRSLTLSEARYAFCESIGDKDFCSKCEKKGRFCLSHSVETRLMEFVLDFQ